MPIVQMMHAERLVNMSHHLLDLAYKRNWKEAIVFYIVYMPCALLLFAVLTLPYAYIISDIPMGTNFTEAFGVGRQMGKSVGDKLLPVCGLIISLGLSVLIIRAKKNYSAKAIGAATLSVLLSIFGFAIFFLPLAYMTTLAPIRKQEV